MGIGQIVGLHLRVHGLNKQSGVAAVVLAFAADGTLVDWVGEESVAIEAVVVGEWTNHRVVGKAKFGFEGRLARYRRRARSRTVSWCSCREKWTVGVVMWATAAHAQWIHHSARSGR